MASPETLDVAALLEPISDEKPVGEDPRSDSSPTSLYYATKDARNSARSAERQAVLAGEEATNTADWRPVLDNGQLVLKQVGKDLEMAAYMIEAMVRLHGFAGFRDGLRLARRLVEEYWDGLYPLPDEDGMETRVAPLTGLNGEDAEGTLISPIHKVWLTQGTSVGPFAYYHYLQAGNVAQIVDEEARQKRLDEGAVSLEIFERAVKETPAEFFTNLVEDIQQCQEEFAQLNSLLDEKCAEAAPPTSNIRSALETCLETVKAVARDKLAVAEAPQEEEEQAAPGEEGEAAPKRARGGVEVADVIRTREDALQTLLKVAEYFRKTEPHTPVSYALEQAVRWGRMSLPELLAELIADESSRRDLFTRVGIQPQEESE